jgi:phosphoenolpyruvate carboxykinase (GTP)
MASETTAAAIGQVGVVRRDPMAMKPFCGYNFADYWAHWLSFTERAGNLPPIFHVNWFRKDQNGKFMWPGYGDNMRVIEWIINRCKGAVEVNETAIGGLPYATDINIDGLAINGSTLEALLDVDRDAWSFEMEQIREYLASYGDRLPAQMLAELDQVAVALNKTN